MDSEFDAEKSEAFIGAARERNLLSDQQAETLRSALPNQSLTPAQLAIELGLLEPFEAEIAEAFIAPWDLAPGYELLDVLGYGALGVVYRARQPRLQRDVAVKAIMQSRLVELNVAARFQQEIAAIGRLQHPNIVSAFDSGTHHRRLFLVMELVRGIDLRQRLQRDGAMDLTTALSVVRQTAAGLSHALAHHIIHRDIKPGNLMLTETPAGFDLPAGVPLVKIADFGMARLTVQVESDEVTRLTHAGSAIGTPMYCAPEQLSGDPVDHRADIYALGATLVSMLSGGAPFKQRTTSKLLTAKLTGESYDRESLPRDLPADVTSLIDRMMAADADDRIDSYDTLIDAVDALAGSAPRGKSAVTSPRSRGPKWRRPGLRLRSKWGVIVSLVLMTVLFAGAMTLLVPRMFVAAEPTLVRSTWSQPLFDGQNVEPWMILAGTWFDDQDADLGRVLAGQGVIYRQIPMPPEDQGDPSAVAVHVAVDLLDAEAAEVHFGFGSEDFDGATRLVVRVTPQQVWLGRRSGIDGEWTVLQERVKPIAKKTDGSPDYHSVVVELHGDRWFVFFDDLQQPFANAKATPGPANHFLQLVAPQAKVFFADISCGALTPRAAATGP
jgi:serine/threonine protein kinase